MRHNKNSLVVNRVKTAAERTQVITVLHATYLQEKGWVNDPATQIPEQDLEREDLSWFVVSINKQPVGVLRILYDPPLHGYAEYGLEMLNDAKNLNISDFLKTNRIAEIGRFAVITEKRNQIMIAAVLMKAAVEETVVRGYTHYITDVFEDDPHSPYGFHTRVMGFVPVATHAHGELLSRSRRITLVLDLKAAYQRLKRHSRWLFRFLTGGWSQRLHRKLSHSTA